MLLVKTLLKVAACSNLVGLINLTTPDPAVLNSKSLFDLVVINLLLMNSMSSKSTLLDTVKSPVIIWLPICVVVPVLVIFPV